MNPDGPPGVPPVVLFDAWGSKCASWRQHTGLLAETTIESMIESIVESVMESLIDSLNRLTVGSLAQL